MEIYGTGLLCTFVTICSVRLMHDQHKKLKMNDMAEVTAMALLWPILLVLFVVYTFSEQFSTKRD